MNSMPKYIARPKAAAVASTAEILPINPSQGLDRTTSPIIHVMILLKGKKNKTNENEGNNLQKACYVAIRLVIKPLT